MPRTRARLWFALACAGLLAATARAAGELNPDAARILMERGIDRLAFVKRLTFSADHVYTEYLNSRWTPGGNICVLDLRTGRCATVVSGLEGGVFNRFDVSFDARKVVFGWKKGPRDGYRIYETRVDGTGLRQLTFPQEDEDELVARYGNRGYHHGTDDLHPCYLPDGGIIFSSTRCQFGILCNSADVFTTKVLFRMDSDGSNMRRLTNSALSEATPAVLPNGNILYHRWEYVDKAAGNAKCLWSMRPDGTGSAEVYGNTLTHPETLIYGRPIPGSPNKVVMIGTSHYPNNAMGSVIVVDTTKNIRTREPMTYITSDVDTRAHGGFHFLIGGKWQYDKAGTKGRLFKDPYPISEDLFIASRKPAGPNWRDQKAYDLVLLDGEGRETPLYSDPDTSCWLPYPLVARRVPPVPRAPVDRRLAERKLAACIVTDVYEGLGSVPRGTIKHIRVMEQVPRSWATRNRWGGDSDGMAHSALGL
ncbi:MAG: TolB family protein, partial [Planctomycetota bacterium]